jgi:uncharacterized protein (TIGR03790 family)
VNFRLIGAFLLCAVVLPAQTADQVLVVINESSAISREIGQYYARRRGIPAANICTIRTAPQEGIARSVYDSEIEAPVGAFLKNHGMQERILYIVLTSGVPLRINGSGEALKTDTASVDSELTLLYQRLRSVKIPLEGPVDNPFFGHRDSPFRHPAFPMYLVTRLDGYNMSDMKGLVDRALLARNVGSFVIDLKVRENNPGNQWLRTAALLLPKDRVILDETSKVLADVPNVIAYASWGSNDTDRKHRYLHIGWLPGAIATEFVSFDGRTFRPPPPKWEIGNWGDNKTWYAGAPQSLTADYIHEGATGASGQVSEPYLAYCPRPDFVLPAYNSGRTLAESFYLGIPGLSWMNVVIGDPLTRLTK